MEELSNPFGFTLRPEGPVLTGLDRVWDDLAIAAEYAGTMPSGRELALRINENPNVELFTPAIAATLHDMLERLAPEGDAGSEDATRLSEFVVHLDTSILTAALRTESTAQRRSALLDNCLKVLSVRAMLRLAQAASIAFNQPFSKPLRRLLRRIARDAVSSDVRLQPEARALFLRVLKKKLVEVRTSHGHAVTQGYKDLFAQAPPHRQITRATPESDRIVQTAIETDAVGEVVWVAVTEMIAAHRERDLVGMLKGLPKSSKTLRMIVSRIANQTLMGSLLDEEPVDFEAVDLMLEHMGLAAAKVLLEQLAESRSRITRREVFQRLVRLGPEIQPLLEVRLKDRRWFVLRNMIALAREAGCVIDWPVMEPFIRHKDPRVRREALLLLLRHDKTYERAVVAALGDTDRNVLRTALQAARSRLSEDGAIVLAERVTSADFPPEFRVLSLHLLGRSNSAVALDALLHFAQAGRTLLGKPKLAVKSPEMLAAVGNLARTWPGERRVSALIAAALKSRDAEVVSAAQIPSTA
jgi:hypothetical protein